MSRLITRHFRPLVRSRPWNTSPSVLYTSIRGLKFNSREYPVSKGFKYYSEELENELRKRFDSLPPSNKVFQNPDGTTRNPSDEELKLVGQLGLLADAKRGSLLDQWKLSPEQREVFLRNGNDLTEYLDDGRIILDKVPTEDPVTGEVTWTIIRENHKEGWENLTYYGYIPALVISLFLAVFMDRESISEWAMEELRIRAQERYNEGMESLANDDSISPEELRNRDALIVERIISGEYDRLSGLQKAGSDLPSSLL